MRVGMSAIKDGKYNAYTRGRSRSWQGEGYKRAVVGESQILLLVAAFLKQQIIATK